MQPGLLRCVDAGLLGGGDLGQLNRRVLSNPESPDIAGFDGSHPSSSLPLRESSPWVNIRSSLSLLSSCPSSSSNV